MDDDKDHIPNGMYSINSLSKNQLFFYGLGSVMYWIKRFYRVSVAVWVTQRHQPPFEGVEYRSIAVVCVETHHK